MPTIIDPLTFYRALYAPVIEQIIYCNMAQFLTPTVFILSIGYWLARLGRLSQKASIAVSSLKGMLFVFCWCIYNYQPNTGDDIAYCSTGHHLQCYELWNIFTICWLSPSEVCYAKLNACVMPFLGNVYIAPVAFNVTCSIAAAAISKSIIEYVFPKLKAQSFFFFFAFCPSMLAWSTAYNLKETFLLLLVVLFAKAMQLFLSGRYYIASIIACFACWMMHGIRFYSAFILMILYGVCAVVSWIAKNRISMSRIIVCGCILSACIFFATWILWGCDLDTYALKISATLNCFSISSPLKTLSLFWLHPLPLRLRLSSAYRILFASAVWTWALLPFCVVGVRKLWCETEQKFFCVFIFGFAVIMWIFYAFAIDGGLSSPRQRFQLEFTIALCQFAGICWAIEKWPLIKESLREWRTSFGKRRVTAPDKIALL